MNEIENKTKTLGKEKITGKRRYLSAEKKYQLFIEAERGGQPLGEILRREGLYSSDLARIRDHVKEGALERLRARSGPKSQTVCLEEYTALKQELEAKERAMADMSVELAILRKKTAGGSWAR
jgi:transposase-like protein